jgi:rubrerythrin
MVPVTIIIAPSEGSINMSIAFNAEEVFKMGMDIETNGEAYYKKAAELVKDPEVKKVLLHLMEEEQKHYITFKKLLESLPPKSSLPTVGDPEGQENLYLNALVKSRLFSNVREAEDVAAQVENAEEALKAALTFEKDTILFFQTMKSMTREDLGQAEIDMLIEEERKHVIKISEELKKLREQG